MWDHCQSGINVGRWRHGQWSSSLPARSLKFRPLSLRMAMKKGLGFNIADSFAIPTAKGTKDGLKDFTTWELPWIFPPAFVLCWLAVMSRQFPLPSGDWGRAAGVISTRVDDRAHTRVDDLQKHLEDCLARRFVVVVHYTVGKALREGASNNVFSSAD